MRTKVVHNKSMIRTLKNIKKGLKKFSEEKIEIKDAKSKGKKFSHGSNRGEPGVVKWDEEKHKWIYVGKK